jgi:hypothetical protein
MNSLKKKQISQVNKYFINDNNIYIILEITIIIIEKLNLFCIMSPFHM